MNANGAFRGLVAPRLGLLVLCSLALLSAPMIVGSAMAQGQGGGGDYRLSCRPPLKFMAGACVPQCYAGYEDRGRWCEERRGGGGGGP